MYWPQYDGYDIDTVILITFPGALDVISFITFG